MKKLLIFLLALSYYFLFATFTKNFIVQKFDLKQEVANKNTKPKKIVVGVIDSGFGFQDKGFVNHLCDKGHRDFTGVEEYSTKFQLKDKVPLDNHGHGTNVVGLIEKYAKGADYCIIVVKFYDEKSSFYQDSELKALEYLTSLKPDIINLSLGGMGENKKETKIIRQYLDNGGIVIAAAGNGKKVELSNKKEVFIGYQLSKKENYYPAMSDDRIIVVGNRNYSGDINLTSNYGDRVNTWEIGEDAESYGLVLTGTSQATAIHTGKLIYNLYRNRR
jgi:hypothetical protein